MNKLNLIKLRSIITLGILLCLISCKKNKDGNKTSKWEGTTWQQLISENIKLRIPDDFKPSSRYRIREDIPILSNDTTQLRLIENSLERLEFEDSEIDVYVDTTKTFRMIVICNISELDFNKNHLALLKRELRINNELSESTNSSLRFGEIKAQMKGNQNFKLARFTTPIHNIERGNSIYNSIYYLSGNSITLVVYEFSEDEESVEKYLWTTTVG